MRRIRGGRGRRMAIAAAVTLFTAGASLPATGAGRSDVSITIMPGSVEGSPIEVTFELDPPPSTTLELAWSVREDLADGSDLGATRGQVDFSPGQSTATMSIPTVDDEVAEYPEKFLIAAPGTDVHGAAAAVEILADNEPPVIEIHASLPDASEPDRMGEFVIHRRGDVSSPTHVDVDVHAGNRVVLVSTRTSEELRYPYGAVTIHGSQRFFEVLVVDDISMTGPNEAMIEVLPGDGYALGPSTVAVVTIDDDDPAVRRVSGSDRYATSRAMVTWREQYCSPPPRQPWQWCGGDAVVVARGDLASDATSAARLAAALDAPLMLTEADDLPDSALYTIQGLHVRTAYVVGGPNSVTDQVLAQLDHADVSVVHRVAGADRYLTAVEVARLTGGPDPVEVVVAGVAGGDPSAGMADALVAAVYAAANGFPLVLVHTDGIPEVVDDYLRSMNGRITIVGGPASVSRAVEADLRQLTGNLTRISGPDRFATAVAVADTPEVESPHRFGATFAWLVNGTSWVDAAVAIPAVSATGGVLLYADGQDPEGSAVTHEWLQATFPTSGGVTIVGGENAISETVRMAVESEIGSPAPRPRTRPSHEGFSISVDTDRAIYDLGQPVLVTAVVCNRAAHPVRHSVYQPPFVGFWISDEADERLTRDEGVYPALVDETEIPPGCTFDAGIWDQRLGPWPSGASDDPPEHASVGRYQAGASWRGREYEATSFVPRAPSAPFEIR